MAAGAANGDRRAKAQAKAKADPFENVVRFEPITGPVLRWRLAGRRLRSPGDTGAPAHTGDDHVAAGAEAWHERLRRHMYNNDGPSARRREALRLPQGPCAAVACPQSLGCDAHRQDRNRAQVPWSRSRRWSAHVVG